MSARLQGDCEGEIQEYRAWMKAEEKESPPKVYMLQNNNAAANLMKISGHNVIFMMQTNASRNDTAHSKVNEYVQNAASAHSQSNSKSTGTTWPMSSRNVEESEASSQ